MCNVGIGVNPSKFSIGVNNPSEKLHVQSGSTGIGVESPKHKLDVSGFWIVDKKAFTFFERLIMKIVGWYCDKKGMTVNFSKYFPSEDITQPKTAMWIGGRMPKITSGGHVGIGV